MQDDDEIIKIILLGNPGKGRSSFGNRMAEKLIFTSGQACGYGLTVQSESVQCGNKIYIDTPGLYGISSEHRKYAAKEIRRQFAEGGRFQVLFFATELEGRIHDGDRLVIKMVLDAVPEIQDKYAVIFNRCRGLFMERSRDDYLWKREFEFLFLEQLPFFTRHICYVPHSVDMECVFDGCAPLAPEVKAFLEAVPKVTIKKDSAKAINEDSPEDWLEEIRQSEKSRQKLNVLLDQVRRYYAGKPDSQSNAQQGDIGVRQSIERFQQIAEKKAKKNTKIAVILLFIFLIPAVAAISIDFLFQYSWVMPLGSKKIIVQKLLAPMLAAHLTFSIVSCGKALTQEATDLDPDILDVTVRWPDARSCRWCLQCLFDYCPCRCRCCPHNLFDDGFYIHIPGYKGRLKQWQVWMLQRLLNLVSDLATLRTYCTSSQVPAVVSSLWGLTLMVSVFATAGALLNKLSMNTARLVLFGCEDDIQAVLVLIVLFQYTGSTIQIAEIKSCASAFLSILQGIGDLRARQVRFADQNAAVDRLLTNA